ncbi:MAG TPA: AbrB/MazE/SpoVT family DNA-binding domain-containing protein [Candidatus Nanoarchaeia archaeon]|nr:AbrB/MazE/SpoVT family DNA-binding domain-containing protein [Candidatus Nanoarchaeia archaeon]
MEVALTKISSKGQIVIPAAMREKLSEGDTLMLIQSNDQIILKKASDLDKNFEDDIRFAKRTESAYKKYLKGEFIEMDFDQFIEKAKKW